VDVQGNVVENNVLMACGTKSLPKLSHGEHHGTFPDAPEAGNDLRILLVIVREFE
jgi:hypothetical protein